MRDCGAVRCPRSCLNVVNLSNIATGSEYTLPKDLIESLESQGEKVTERIAARARESGVETVTRVVSGFPAADILEYADENDIDLIAMGTAGRTGLNRFLVGSTTERIIRHAICLSSQSTPETSAVTKPEDRHASSCLSASDCVRGPSCPRRGGSQTDTTMHLLLFLS